MGSTLTRQDLTGMIAEAAKQAVAMHVKVPASSPSGVPTMLGPAILAENKAKESKDGKQLVGRYLQVMLAGAAKQAACMDMFQKHYKGDERLEKALSSSDFSAGGSMVGTEVSRELIELLRPASVIMAANPQIAQMATGTLEIPRHTAGSTGAYVGENQIGGVSQPTTGMLVLSRKKLKVEIPFSNDFTRFAVLNGDEFIRRDAVDGLQVRQDAAFIRDDGLSFTPQGLRFWVLPANVFDASGDGDTLPNIDLRLREAEVALRGANVGMLRPHWFFSSRTWGRLNTIRTGGAADGEYAFRDEMARGTLNGHPWAVSNQIPENLGGGTESEVYFVDMADVVVGEALDMIVDVFPGGAYNDGTAVRSGISRDQTVLRALMQHDLGMRHDESLAVISGVVWGV